MTYMPVSDEVSSAMDRDLQAHVDRHFGIDVRSVRSVVAWGNLASKSLAVALTPVTGQLRNAQEQGQARVIELPGGDFVVAHSGQTLLVGSKDTVAHALDALAGKTPGLMKGKSDLAGLVEGNVAKAKIALAFDVRVRPSNVPMLAGLRHAAVRYSGDHVSIELTGENSALKALSSQLTTVIGTMLEQAGRRGHPGRRRHPRLHEVHQEEQDQRSQDVREADL